MKTQFKQDGFLHLPNIYEASQFHKMNRKIETLLEAGTDGDIHRNEAGTPSKLSYLLSKGDEFLAFLTEPTLLDIAISLSPNPQELVPTWDDLVIKYPRTGAAVGLHQDMGMGKLHTKTVFSIAIYLTKSDNPVYFLPGSHHLGPQTFEQLKEIWNTRKSEFVPVCTKPGDLLIHNAHILHYSPANTSTQNRLTWYLEFRTIHDLIVDSPWDMNWILKRRCLLLHSLRKRKAMGLAVPDCHFEDLDNLIPIAKNNLLRVVHQTATAEFDWNSPYFHFNEVLYE